MRVKLSVKNDFRDTEVRSSVYTVREDCRDFFAWYKRNSGHSLFIVLDSSSAGDVRIIHNTTLTFSASIGSSLQFGAKFFSLYLRIGRWSPLCVSIMTFPEYLLFMETDRPGLASYLDIQRHPRYVRWLFLSR